MNRIGIAQVLRNALGVLVSNLVTVLFIAVLLGGVGWAIAEQVGQLALQIWPPKTPQQGMIIGQLAQTAWLVIWGCLVGSWAAPATLYLWVQHEKKRPSSLYEAINYGLNRYSRVLPAHSRALFIVQLGLIVIVPGILFGLQYAFVDAIATLDTAEKNPIARSRKLTSGRRGTLFRTFAVFLIWWAPLNLGGLFWIHAQPTWVIAAAGVVDAIVLIFLDLCMVQFYLDLFRKPAAAPVPVPQTV